MIGGIPGIIGRDKDSAAGQAQSTFRVRAQEEARDRTQSSLKVGLRV